MEPDSAKKDFHHPYTPYDIQLQFMRALYTCIEERKVGIFESPTGTGKSLSLICGSLTWLREHKRAAFEENVEKTDGDDEPEWILEHSRQEKRKTILNKRRRLEKRLARIRAEEERQRSKQGKSEHPSKKLKSDSKKAGSDQDGDSQFELDDYNSEDEQDSSRQKTQNNGDALSADTLALLEKLKGPGLTNREDEDEDDEGNDTKIYYCSRMHSQLTQFAQEMGRVTFPPSAPPEIESEDPDHPDEAEISEGLKHIALGSRKTLCINPKVQALGNPVAINERCLDLQKPGVAADHKCPFLPSKENEALVTDFRDHALAKVRDIEDIGGVGQKMGICPYYASRSVIKSSEIITLPYPLLLQKTAREALNISLKDEVIIIDEAHNLTDVISNIHSATVTLTQLRRANEQLTTYARKFKTRLKGKNRVYVAQVIRLVTSIAGYLQSILDSKGPAEGAVKVSDLISGKGVDQLNPHKLSRYLHESKLARKVDGYIEHSESSSRAADERNAPKQAVPVLFQVQSFLLPLMNPSAEGRLFFERTGGDVQLRYLLLDPTNHFREIVDEARAVILAGGTMSPIDDYAERLFSYLEPERLKTFSYGHVIPEENLTAAAISTGVLGTELDFTYAKRNDGRMLVDLGKTVVALCKVIPDGVVAFFPSYEYLNQVIESWKKPLPETDSTSILDRLAKSKPVFYEPPDRNTTTTTDALLQNYSNAVDKGSGGLLLSVMGGKLSEGINFSDKLGRGVIVIGLPFPNIRSAIWQAKMQHVEQKAYETAQGSEEGRRGQGKAAGREFYENSCMRTVNQCIGRAIRHQNDFAAILMLDQRYRTPRIQKKLPSWIRQSLMPEAQQSTGRTISSFASFFYKKREGYG